MGLWDSFDISGHTFLLNWCVYVSIHELHMFFKFLESTHSFFIESIVFLIFGWNVVLNLLWCVMLGKLRLFRAKNISIVIKYFEPNKIFRSK